MLQITVVMSTPVTRSIGRRGQNVVGTEEGLDTVGVFAVKVRPDSSGAIQCATGAVQIVEVGLFNKRQNVSPPRPTRIRVGFPIHPGRGGRIPGRNALKALW